MNNFDSFIPLGETCNISFLTNNCKIKEETSVFEWFITTSLKSISNIILKITEGSHINIYQQDDKIYIEDETISSSYYTLEEFIPIFKRRSVRLLEQIKNSKKLLFIRFEIRKDILYTLEDYDTFQQSIQLINPLVEMKLLLIRPDMNQINHANIIHKYVEYDTIHKDLFCLEASLNNIFVNILNEVGYPLKNKNEKKFTDRN